MTAQINAFDLLEKNGVLIVVPLGDSISFRGIDLQSDLETIKNYMKANQLFKMILDLGSTSYFGSIMIGLFNELERFTKELGGQMLVCNTSPEMLEVLKVMKLTDKWSFVPTRKKALQILKIWKE